MLVRTFVFCTNQNYFIFIYINLYHYMFLLTKPKQLKYIIISVNNYCMCQIRTFTYIILHT